jgi:hypothetical protein
MLCFLRKLLGCCFGGQAPKCVSWEDLADVYVGLDTAHKGKAKGGKGKVRRIAKGQAQELRQRPARAADGRQPRTASSGCFAVCNRGGVVV